MTNRFDPITGKVISVFFHYAIPSVIGMLAVTSAGVIDGIFVGNFIGATALAAINISMPVFALFAAVVFMLNVGGSVMCGKFLGEGDQAAASSIFSKTLYASFVLALLISGGILLFLDEVVSLLGANEDLRPLVIDYMIIIVLAAPLLILAPGLLLLPLWLGDAGVYLAIPIAEAITFLIALMLVFLYRPSDIVRALDAR